MRFKSLYPFCLCLLLVAGSATGQAYTTGTRETDWWLASLNQFTPSIYLDHHVNNTPADVLYFTEGEAIMPVAVKSGPPAVVKLNSKAQQRWKRDIKGSILGLGKLEGKVLVLYSPERMNGNDYTNISAVHASLIDPVTGKVEGDKIIQNISGSNFSDIRMLKSDDGTFQQLMVRVTKWVGKKTFMTGKVERAIRQSSEINFYTIAPDLSVQPACKVPFTNEDGEFLQASSIPGGGQLVLWTDGRSLVLEQYSKEGKSLAKLSSPFEWSTVWHYGAVLKMFPGSATKGVFTLTYRKTATDPRIRTVTFDLARKEQKQTEEEMDNSVYRKKLEAEIIVPEGVKPTIEKRVFPYLKAIDILFVNNQAVIIKEAKGWVGKTWFSGDALVTVLDSEGNTQKNYLVNKFYETFVPYGLTSGYHVAGNKLQLIMNHKNTLVSFTTLFGEIDLKEHKWEKFVTVSRPAGSGNSDNPIEAGGTAWFGNSLLLHFLNKPLLETDVTTRLQAVKL